MSERFQTYHRDVQEAGEHYLQNLEQKLIHEPIQAAIKSAQEQDQYLTQKAEELLRQAHSKSRHKDQSSVVLYPANEANVKSTKPYRYKNVAAAAAGIGVLTGVIHEATNVAIVEAAEDHPISAQFENNLVTFDTNRPQDVGPTEPRDPAIPLTGKILKTIEEQKRAETAWNAALTTQEVGEAMIAQAQSIIDKSTPENQNQERSYFVPEVYPIAEGLSITNELIRAQMAEEIKNLYEPQINTFNFQEGEVNVILSERTNENGINEVIGHIEVVRVNSLGEVVEKTVFIKGADGQMRAFFATGDQKIEYRYNSEDNQILTIVRGDANDIAVLQNSNGETEIISLSEIADLDKYDASFTPQDFVFFISVINQGTNINVREGTATSTPIVGQFQSEQTATALRTIYDAQNNPWHWCVIKVEDKYTIGYIFGGLTQRAKLGNIQVQPTTPSGNKPIMYLRTAANENTGVENTEIPERLSMFDVAAENQKATEELAQLGTVYLTENGNAYPINLVQNIEYFYYDTNNELNLHLKNGREIIYTKENGWSIKVFTTQLTYGVLDLDLQTNTGGGRLAVFDVQLMTPNNNDWITKILSDSNLNLLYPEENKEWYADFIAQQMGGQLVNPRIENPLDGASVIDETIRAFYKLLAKEKLNRDITDEEIKTGITIPTSVGNINTAVPVKIIFSDSKENYFKNIGIDEKGQLIIQINNEFIQTPYVNGSFLSYITDFLYDEEIEPDFMWRNAGTYWPQYVDIYQAGQPIYIPEGSSYAYKIMPIILGTRTSTSAGVLNYNPTFINQ